MEAFIFPLTETILSTITPPIKYFLVLSARYDSNYIITYFLVIGKWVSGEFERNFFCWDRERPYVGRATENRLAHIA